MVGRAGAEAKGVGQLRHLEGEAVGAVDELDRVVAPLREAGWRPIEDYAEESWEFGDSVAYDLERADKRMEVELSEDGRIDVYRLASEQGSDPNAEPSEPLFVLYLDEAEASRREAFGREGWLDPPASTS